MGVSYILYLDQMVCIQAENVRQLVTRVYAYVVFVMYPLSDIYYFAPFLLLCGFMLIFEGS
jgi:hypothetical protein